MEFTAEQQTHIDGLIKDAYRRAYAKAQETAADDIAAAVSKAETKHRNEVKELKKKQEELETALENKNNVDDSAIRAKLDGIEAKLKAAGEKVAISDLVAMAGKHNAVDPKQAAVLLRMHTTADDDGNLTVVNADGKPRNGADGKPMSLDALAAEYFESNQHLVKASGTSGSGGEGVTGNGAGAAKTIKRADFEKLSPSEQMTTAREKGLVITD